MTSVSLEKVTLDDVLDRLTKDAENKKDFMVPTNNLVALPNGKIKFKDVNKVNGEEKSLAREGLEFDTTDWADGQLMTRLGMPGAYFKKVKTQEPELFAEHFNYWAPRDDSVIRLRTKVFDSAALIRGAVSDKYSPLDNDKIGEMLYQLFEMAKQTTAELEITSFYLDDKRFHLRVSYPDLTKPLRPLPDGTPDYSRIGQDFVNSEVSAASFNLAALVWREICTNGLRGWGRDWQFVQRHIHLRPLEFQSRVAEAMVESLKKGSELLTMYEETQRQQIPNPFLAIQNLVEEGGFNKKFVDTVKDNYDGDGTVYGVINAFTQAARDLPNEERLETECFAGKLISFPQRKWESLQAEPMIGEGLEDEEVV